MVILFPYGAVVVLGLPLVPVTALLCKPIPGPISEPDWAPVLLLTPAALCAPAAALAPLAETVLVPGAGVAPAPAGLAVVAPPPISRFPALVVLAAVPAVP